MTITENTTDSVDNGVNVEALLGARAALTDAPAAAAFTWTADCSWVSGTHSRTTVAGFSGLGQQHERPATHTVDTDHPAVFAAEDNGMPPAEMVLAGLAGCLTAGVASVATNRGIQLRSVTATVEGDMDLQGILGIDSEVRNGFNDIRVRFDIDADATDEEIAGIVAQSQKRSAVYDAVTNPTSIVVES